MHFLFDGHPQLLVRVSVRHTILNKFAQQNTEKRTNNEG
uniref:Uncharacterized protein n=1 Tax=Arundo donax TaxID=35708 RepID=A0A0A9GJU8_ARUDO